MLEGDTTPAPRVGCDLVELEEFARNLERPGFREKVFHSTEILYCERRAGRLGSYAARFAAKEALGKALGNGLLLEGIRPTDVWVSRGPQESGRPELQMVPELRHRLNEAGYRGADVSLTHTRHFASAVVMLY